MLHNLVKGPDSRLPTSEAETVNEEDEDEYYAFCNAERSFKKFFLELPVAQCQVLRFNRNISEVTH